MDRDGTLTSRSGLTWRRSQIIIHPQIPRLVAFLNKMKIPVIVVTNQAVVARGLINEVGVEKLNSHITQKISDLGGKIDKFYFCPHHPQANLLAFRRRCSCRKPNSALFKRAAKDLDLDLSKNFMVGDMIVDIESGRRLSMRTVLLMRGHKGEDKNIRSNQILLPKMWPILST